MDEFDFGWRDWNRPGIFGGNAQKLLLRGAFEKLNMSDQSSLPGLYRAGWPTPKPRRCDHADNALQSAARSRVIPEQNAQRPRSTAGCWNAQGGTFSDGSKSYSNMLDRPVSAAARGAPNAVGFKKGLRERKRR